MADDTQAKLTSRAKELIQSLAASGVESVMPEGSIRQYFVKLTLSQGGNVVIYYSPKKDRFTYQLEKIDDAVLKATIASCWDPAERQQGDPSSAHSERISVYVDGSYIKESVGYGAVVVKDGKILWETQGHVDPDVAGSTRQVAGELAAVRESLEWCMSNGISSVTIFYDYEGIEKWATGGWKAKKTITQEYKDYINAVSVDVEWVKVAAHTGDKWNEHADQLAKAGALAKAPAQEEDLDSVFYKHVGEVVVFLRSQGFEYTVKNEQKEPYFHSQLAIEKAAEPCGYLNVYATDKKGVSVRFHEIVPGERASIEQLWCARGSATENPLAEVDYYYSALKPFSDYRFDFVVLAQAIASVWDSFCSGTFDADVARYEFSQLDSARTQLKSAVAGKDGG
jgi:ribonuclease HI